MYLALSYRELLAKKKTVASLVRSQMTFAVTPGIGRTEVITSRLRRHDPEIIG